MPKGIKGFQKGHAVSLELRQKLSQMRMGKKLSEETKSKMRGRKGWKRGLVGVQAKENHPNWKGGLPKCENCKNELSFYKSKTSLCKKCLMQSKIHHPRWKGGLTELPEYHSFLQQRRERKKKSNGGTHTFEQWLALKIKYGFMCLCCKKTEPEIKLTEDHIIPLSKGGTDDILNVQPLCRSCNSIKHTKIFDYRELFI